MASHVQCWLAGAALALGTLTLSGTSVVAADAADDVPAHKRTRLGLYVTAKQAYAQWQQAQHGSSNASVKIIDVRTPGEYLFVGHPAMAYNVPLKLLAHRWNDQQNRPVMVTNAHFVDQVRRIAGVHDTVFLMCRSGVRSAAAVNLLAEAGFDRAYSITDGFEGDANREAAEEGRPAPRNVNGWKNSGAPWTTQLDREHMYIAPTAERK